MTPAEAKDWLGVAALLISVSGAFYAWLTRGSKDNSEQIGKLDSRMDDMSTRLQSVEHELKHMPDRETISDLRVSVEGLKAGLNAMGSQTQTMAASVRRIEDYLLKAPK